MSLYIDMPITIRHEENFQNCVTKIAGPKKSED